MNKKLYDLMDWAAIEEITYSESQNPHAMLGLHKTGSDTLMQAYIPTAKKISFVPSVGEKKQMEEVDEGGFFAVLTDVSEDTPYTLEVTYDNGVIETIHDPYSYNPLYTKDELAKFDAGNYYDVYKKMGAHVVSMGTGADKVSGVYFSVWAPEAMRVSVVGDFNLWDGRRHQMRKLKDSGIYEIFIPGLLEGTVYKYEIKTAKGEPMLKSDPYGYYAEMRPHTASIVTDITGFKWSDKDWMSKRGELTKTGKPDKNGKPSGGTPLNIYEVHLGSWMRKEVSTDDSGKEIYGSEFYNYKDIAVKLADYVLEMGYTHIELMPVMEHPLDASWGYQVTGYYAPTSRYGTPEDFMWFMNYMHEHDIGVILDWVPAHFPRDLHGLAAFDGSHVYEHADPRQGTHPHWGTLIYNYGRPQVANFLISNALFWATEYHADGIRMDAVASMLYLDYGKNLGEWVPNIYGGHENLEAIAFLKHLNLIYKKRCPDSLLIAEESTAWPMITGDIDGEGLGFDYKWNMGWMNDFLGYMKYDPYFRGQHYGELTFSMLYQYSENFILVLSHDEVVHGKCSMVNKMPGDTFELKFANLRAAYGFMATHPGKKLLFMGQEFAQMDEWNEDRGIEWELLKYPIHENMHEYVKALNHLYKEHDALWQKDDDPEGFEWINCHSYEECVIAFMRKSEKEDLLVVCNFSNVEFKKFDVGVPYYGTFTELINSDDKKFGGSGMLNKPKTSKKADVDDRDEAITISIPPLSMMVFACEKQERPKRVVKKPAVKKTETKKTEAKKTATKKATTKTTKKSK